MMHPASLSIIIPAFNEEATIIQTLEGVLSGIPETLSDYEILVMDDGSRDKTSSLVTAFSQRHRNVSCISLTENRGKGGALRAGFASVKKEWMLFVDADYQVRLDALLQLRELENSDAVVGYRTGRRDSMVRNAVSASYRLLVRVALGVSERDVNCPFKLIRTEVLQSMPLVSTGFLIDAEMLYRLRKIGIAPKEVPVTWHPRTGGRSSIRLRHLGELLRELILVLLDR